MLCLLFVVYHRRVLLFECHFCGAEVCGGCEFADGFDPLFYQIATVFVVVSDGATQLGGVWIHVERVAASELAD